MISRKFILRTCVVMVACAACQAAFAAEKGIELRAGATYSDNIRRASDDTEDQMIATVGINLDISGESRRWEGGIAGDIEFQKFLDDAFEDETIPAINADLTLKLAPDLFHWVTEGSFGQYQQNLFAASTPDTRENVSRISTGPDLIVRLGARTNVNVQGRYALTDFEIADADSSTASASLSLVRSLSSTRTVSLNGSGERMEYDIGQGDFERYSAYLGFDSAVSKGSLNAKLGVNEIQSNGDSFQSTLAGLSWNRQLTAISSISLSVDQSYSDAGDYLNRFDSTYRPPSGVGDVVPARDPFETKRLSASYSHVKGRVTWSVGLYASDDAYQSSSDLDSRRLGGSFNFGVDFASAWSAALGAQYEDRDFQATGLTDQYLTGSISIDRQLSKKFSLGFIYALNDRGSTGTGEDYSENRYSLLIRFSPQS